jgi:hypothetical protein
MGILLVRNQPVLAIGNIDSGGGGGGVLSISNLDDTLTISPATGDVIASLNLTHANTWTGIQTFQPAAFVGTGTMSVGTSGTGVLVLGNSIAPTSAPADEIQLFSADYTAGDARLRVLSESGTGLWMGNGTIEAVAPTSGAGNSLTLRASNAASGNSNGGNLLVRLAAKSGSGVDGKLIVQAATALPGGNLTEWQNSSGVAQTFVNSTGRLGVLATNSILALLLNNATYNFAVQGSVGSFIVRASGNQIVFADPSGSNNAAGRIQGTNITFTDNTNDLCMIYCSTGHLTTGGTADVAQLHAVSNAATTITCALRTAASQTANALELQTSTPNTYAYIPPGTGATGIGSGIYFKNNGTGYLGLTAGAGIFSLTNGSAGSGLSSAANTPAQITADQNNYSPGVGLFQRWSSDASRNVTGVVAGVDGEMRFVWNVGANDIVLENESLSSTAANRLTTSTLTNLTMSANKCAVMMYSTSTSRWLTTTINPFGSYVYPVTSQSSNYNLSSADLVCLANASGGPIDITLPTAVGITGKIYIIKKTDSSANNVGVMTTSSQTIDGNLSYLLTTQYQSIELLSDGANWNVI